MDLSFEEWVACIFDQPADGPEWFRDREADSWEAPSLVQAEYLARLFETSHDSLLGYSDTQVNRGLWFVAGNAEFMFALIDECVDWTLRRRAIRAMCDLYANCFAPRCAHGLSHLDEPNLSPLNGICYMWFDIIPIFGQPNEPGRAEVDEEMVSLMERILQLDSEACQEGALHGLGHWQMHYPKRARKIIDAYLARNRKIRSPLRQYALNARSGCIQ